VDRPGRFRRGAGNLFSPDTISFWAEKMKSRETLVRSLLPSLVARYSPTGLKSWSGDYIPGIPLHGGRKGMDYFLFEHGPRPFPEIVGFLRYSVRHDPKSNRWLAEIHSDLTSGALVAPECSKSFASAEKAWLQCAIWCARNEFNDPESYSRIPEVPFGKTIGPQHFTAYWQARIQLKSRAEPYFYNLCLNMDAATSHKQFESLLEQVQDAKFLDRIARGEKISPEEKVKFKLVHAIELERKRTKRANLDPIDEEIMEGYIRYGMLYVPMSLLAPRLNLKLGTQISPRTLQQRFKRLRLKSCLSAGAVPWYYRLYYREFRQPRGDGDARKFLGRTKASQTKLLRWYYLTLGNGTHRRAAIIMPKRNNCRARNNTRWRQAVRPTHHAKPGD
jgi:hypothetical protein